MSDLTAFELKILRECAGTAAPMPWGAAGGAALETLKGAGFFDSDGVVTAKGRAAIYQMFVAEVLEQAIAARAKFPQPNPTIAALAEEVGELAQALLHIREGKHDDWRRVWDEAVQVAAMALRAATEGDATIGAVPR